MDLNYANLEDADLRDCTITDVSFTGARFSENTKWPESLNWEMLGALGPGTKVNGGRYRNKHFLEIDLSRAVLVSCDFSGARLTEGTLINCQLRNCNFSNCNLKGADLSNAVIEESQFIRARFDKKTQFPSGFDPVARGMVLTKDEFEP